VRASELRRWLKKQGCTFVEEWLEDFPYAPSSG